MAIGIDYATDELKNSLSNPLVIHLTPQHEFSNLIFSQEIQDATMTYKEKNILSALKAGRDVIISGDMSQDLYQQLISLIYGDPPYIDANGIRVETPGRLRIVMPSLTNKNYYFLQPPLVKTYSMEDYRSIFSADAEHFNNIERFYSMWIKISPSVGPKEPAISRQLIQRMINALKEEKPLHPNNPIKGLVLYDYPKNSEEYALLNIIGKMTFKPDIQHEPRLDKIKSLVDSEEPLDQKIFRFLNCLSGYYLKSVFKNGIEEAIDFQTTPPKPKPELINQITFVFDYFKKLNVDASLETKSHVKKRERQLDHLLSKKDPFIFVRGSAGTGKTHTIKKLKEKKNIVLYESPTDWLPDTSDKIKILMLDEANMKKPGTWDFLKGLSQDKKSYVDDEGNVHPLIDKHKVIFIGNPEGYAFRDFHPLFRHGAESLLFKPPEKDFLEKEFLEKILVSIPHKKSLYDIFITSFRVAQEFNAAFVYSLRDISNAAKRFVASSSPEYSRKDAFEACFREFSTSIKGQNERLKFKRELMQKLKIQTPIVAEKNMIKFGPKDAPLFLPPEKKYLIDAIRETIRMSEYESKSDSPVGYFKPGMLIEGNSGLGKSTIFEAVAREMGYSMTAENPTKRYYKITAGNKTNAKRDLQRAIAEGGIVILDEVNLDPELEALVMKLCDQRPRGLIFGSQNSSREAGRFETCPALLNRLQVEYMSDFSRKELVSIAQHHQIVSPNDFVAAYESAKKAHPKTTTMRTFYEGIKMATQMRAELHASP